METPNGTSVPERENRADNDKSVTWFEGCVGRQDREGLHKHPSYALWFTGLSASGKSTVASLLEKELHKNGYSTYILDGDNIRHGLCSDLGFSEKDRAENIRRIGQVLKLFVDAGVIALAAFISPYRCDRDRVRSLFAEGEFFEVFLDCPVDVCEQRDPKGLYEKARAGVIKNFTGISDPYEPPDHPEIVLRSHCESPAESVRNVMNILKEKGLLRDDE